MPPKARWKTQQAMATPDFNSASAVVHSVGPKPQTMSEAVAQLKSYIKRCINDSNLLGLGDSEIESTADIVASCTDKKEIFNWASTLMLPESFAAEVVKRREDIARIGTRTDDDTVSTTSLATAASKASRKKQGAGARGKAVNLAAADKDETGGLVVGQFFECGCFATTHAFRANCLNCGRIICMQESDDSCYACGMDPAVCLAYEVKRAEGQVDAAADAKNRAEYDKAVAQRDKLLQYAKERAKRTVVIDDQSGMYANTAWVSEEERQASKQAETEERKRVAQLHRSTGAYTVHLDIVNQATCLGATALLQKSEESVARREATGDDATARLTDAEAAGRYGLGDGTEPEQPAAAAVVEVPHVPEALLAHARQSERVDDVEPIALSDDDDADDEHGGRVEALPSLVQRIFYGNADAAQGNVVTAKKKQKNDDAGAAAPSADKPLGAAQEQQRKAALATRRDPESRRVQTDYYEDDKITWRVARQQRRAGAAYGADDDDSEADADSSDEPLSPVRKQRPAPPPPLPEQPSSSYVDPCAAAAPAPGAYDDEPGCAGPSPSVPDYTAVYRKLRHKDEGMCLSMHQPWASLLIAGIKTHEGRAWPSDFRGRLWIHAAAARPSHVEEIEAQYVPFLKPGQEFPQDYPTSCLLGYVVAVDNLDRAAYEEAFPPEQRQESSEFKFICEGAKPLPFPLAMDGKHKIFKLEKKLWLAARKQLNEGPPK